MRASKITIPIGLIISPNAIRILTNIHVYECEIPFLREDKNHRRIEMLRDADLLVQKSS